MKYIRLQPVFLPLTFLTGIEALTWVMTGIEKGDKKIKTREHRTHLFQERAKQYIKRYKAARPSLNKRYPC